MTVAGWGVSREQLHNTQKTNCAHFASIKVALTHRASCPQQQPVNKRRWCKKCTLKRQTPKQLSTGSHKHFTEIAIEFRLFKAAPHSTTCLSELPSRRRTVPLPYRCWWLRKEQKCWQYSGCQQHCLFSLLGFGFRKTSCWAEEEECDRRAESCRHRLKPLSAKCFHWIDWWSIHTHTQTDSVSLEIANSLNRLRRSDRQSFQARSSCTYSRAALFFSA